MLSEAVAELDPRDDLGEAVLTFEPTSFLLRRHDQLDCHGQTGLSACAPARFRFTGRGVVSLTMLKVRTVPPTVQLVPVFGIWMFQFGLDGTPGGAACRLA
jgi:hypothetical protein